MGARDRVAADLAVDAMSIAERAERGFLSATNVLLAAVQPWIDRTRNAFADGLVYDIGPAVLAIGRRINEDRDAAAPIRKRAKFMLHGLGHHDPNAVVMREAVQRIEAAIDAHLQQLSLVQEQLRTLREIGRITAKRRSDADRAAEQYERAITEAFGLDQPPLTRPEFVDDRPVLVMLVPLSEQLMADRKLRREAEARAHELVRDVAPDLEGFVAIRYADTHVRENPQ
ncbi:hypothetical protein [Elioraea rosea]|uniref:hypothetical protein n=1 Tax=Elioraea rosea TaxID=2492390 RepID=UPI001182FD82|nr:hypothetical protein [Elioraea rosea]